MEPSEKPLSNSALSLEDDETNFKQAFAEVEQLLQELKQRHNQIQQAQYQKNDLQQQRQQLQAELQRIKDQLEALEVDLESRLFTWSSQREVFWQFVRFAGLGFVAALVLNAFIR